MKSSIHPAYSLDTKVTCTCGNSFTTGSTIEEIHIELCSNCHPFFTGEMKFVDTQGRVEKFQAQRTRANKLMASKKPSKNSPSPADDQPKTLKEMLTQVKAKTKLSPEKN